MAVDGADVFEFGTRNKLSDLEAKEVTLFMKQQMDQAVNNFKNNEIRAQVLKEQHQRI